MLHDRITIDPASCTGKPCIRGMRSSGSPARVLAAGETRESILTSYPYLKPRNINAALLYAGSLGQG